MVNSVSGCTRGVQTRCLAIAERQRCRATLNDLERHNSPYFAFFSPNSIALQADYVTMIEDRPIHNVRKILSPSSSPPLLAKTKAPCSADFPR